MPKDEEEGSNVRRSRQLPWRWQVTFVVFLMVLLLALDVYATHQVFTVRHPGANDFYSRWRAAQLFWQYYPGPHRAARGVGTLVRDRFL
jgi:hypothetical protein